MKKLAKVLAIFALAIISIAVSRRIIDARAASFSLVDVNGKKWSNVGSSPDVNVKLRGRQIVNMYKGLVKIPYPKGDPPDKKAPQLCTIFSSPRVPIFQNLYQIGVYNGAGSGYEPNPPHMADFQTQPGETIYTPRHGYDIGDGLGYLVIYADEDSIALHVGDNDGTIDGYAIHFLNLNVNPELVKAYQSANGAGRGELPALGKHAAVGTAKGSSVTVVIRDTGSFMDPRSALDWYSDCNGIDLGNIVPTDGTAGGSGKNLSKTAQTGTSFPPIHSLTACPPEFPTLAEIKTEKQPAPINTGACTNKDQITQLLSFCENPETMTAKNGEGGQGNPISVNWCPPQYTERIVTAVLKSKAFCSNGDVDERQKCIRKAVGEDYKAICDSGGNDPDDPTPKAIKECKPELIPEIGRHKISYCNWYKNGFGDAANVGQKANLTQTVTLPACVPTNNGSNTRCVTECSTPIEVDENYKLLLGPIQNCLNTQDCVLKMKLSDPKISLPFTKELANYFSGILDAGSVARGELTSTQLKELQAAAAGKAVPTDSKSVDLAKQAFEKTGVVKKILPIEVQDQYKCKFIKYVINKIASGANTKYKFKLDGKDEVFKIDDIRITELNLPPFFDRNPQSDCLPKFAGRTDKGELDEWKVSPSGQAWADVPLFPDDDSQGMIQFASPTLYSSNVQDKDAKVPIGPVYVSVPDVQRLGSAITALQQALVPQQKINDLEQQIADKTYPEAIGQTLQIIKATERIASQIPPNACVPIAEGADSWNKYYSPDLKKSYENARTDPGNVESEFDRGVMCKVPVVTDKDGTQSKICVVGPDGQLFCYREEASTDPTELKSGKTVSDKQILQVRTVIPYLFDMAEQSISPLTGVLRIFKPFYISNQGSSSLATRDQFEEAFKPLPAASDPVKYELTGGNATISDESHNKDWRIFFYKLGGLWNARNFILQVVNPANQDQNKGLAGSQPGSSSR